MNMGGVDLVDVITQAYPSTRKTVKWYKKLDKSAVGGQHV